MTGDQTKTDKIKVSSFVNGVLTEEDATDIFFSFDITTMAFLWEYEHAHGGDTMLTRIPFREQQGDLAFLGMALSAFFRDFFSKPKNYAYLALIPLVVLLVLNLKPLSEMAQEKLMAMLPPEIDMPEPPPPPPPLPEPEPPPPEPEPEPEPIPEELLELLEQEPLKQVEEFQDKLETKRREEDQIPGLKVAAVKRNDVAADLPAAFGNTNRRSDDSQLTSLSHIGTRRRGPEMGAGGGPLRIGKDKRRRSGGEEVNLTPVTVKKKEFSRVEEDLSGRWERIENLGPLAHLNAKCYGKQPGEIIYTGPYKFKCNDNQIVEGWKRK